MCLCVCDECVLKISHTLSNLCSPCRERERKKASKKGREQERKKERNLTSQRKLCGSFLQGSGLQVGVAAGLRGEGEGRRLLQA